MQFKIVVPIYNAEDWIEATIQSLKKQTYKNFQCVLLDDLSTDNTVEVIKPLISGDDRFKLIVNTEKQYALGNHVNGIEILSPDDEDIIVQIDGDDWLAHKNVLQKVKEVYEKTNCLLTYGNHIDYPTGDPRNPLFRYPKNIVETNSFRDYRFLLSHLRTLKYKVWKLIDKQDFLDTDGKYYKTTCDLAMMFPMIEMVGDKFEFIDEVLYVYNASNPLNDFKVNHQEQFGLEMQFRNKKRYNKVF